MTETTHTNGANGAAKALERDIVERAAKPKPGKVIPEQPVWQQLQRGVGAGLTPVAVSARLAEADMGRMASLVDLANAMRQKDGHLQGILETRESAVQRLDWELELPKKPTQKEKKALAFITDALRGPIPALVAHCSSAPFYGYAVTETVWRKSSGYLIPDYFNPVAPRRFVYEGSSLLFQDLPGLPGGVDLRAQYPGQFVISQPRVTGDVPCREGLMRVLVWAALFRNWDLTDWLRLGEIAWRPWRVAKYDRKQFATQEAVDSLLSLVDAMSTSGAGAFPDSVTLDVKWPTGGNGRGPHAELFATMGREMSKCVLGQTETTESSGSSGYAQAKVHDEVKKDKTESDARFIGADITRDLVTWLVVMNFGPRVRVPRLKFITEDAVDLKAFADGLKSMSGAQGAGLRVPAKWARDKAGIPHPLEGEEVIGGEPEAADEDPGEGSDGESSDRPDTKPEGEDAPEE